MTSSVNLDAKTFYERVSQIASNLNTETLGMAEALIIALGNPTEYTVYQKSTALFSWLLGYEFPETVMVITSKKVAVLASHKKVQILDSLRAGSHASIELVTIGREKEAKRSATQFADLFAVIEEASTGGKIRLGVLSKDRNEGPMVEEWNSFLATKSAEYETVEAGPGLSTFLAVKSDEESKFVGMAAKVSSVVMKEHVMQKILTLIDEERKITHSKLSEDIEHTVTEQLKRFKPKLPATLNPDFVDICYPPIIQSGGVYSLKPSAVATEDHLSFNGVVLCSLGARYKSYCSNIGRSFMIDPSKEQEEAFQLLIDLQSHLVSLMTPGTGLARIYEAALELVESRSPELKAHLPNNIGFGMGLEFRESEYVLNAKNTRKLQPGMIFNLVLGFQDIADPSNPAKTYSLLLADTVEVAHEGSRLLTSDLNVLSQVSYSFKSALERRESRKTRAVQATASESAGTRSSRLRTQPKIDVGVEKRRREHQKELARLRLLEAKELYLRGKSASGKAQEAEVQKLESYKKDVLWPKDLKGHRVYVDKKSDTVILPVNGAPVPFHIATIKNASKSEEGKFVFLRINFVTPGRGGGKSDGGAVFMDPHGHFVRSLTIRSSEAYRMQETLKDILDLKKQFTARETARKELSDLVEQADLVEVQGRRPLRLCEIYVRPALDGKRLPGDLEIHSNGVRYRMQLKSEQKIDILFSNIKHLFFQPCDYENSVLIHFHLKNPIIIGKKKTREVQIYRDVLESGVDDTGGRRRKVAYGDEDEIAQEREERRRREQANDEFQSFGEKVAQAYSGLELEIPFRDLGFNGVPGRQTVLLQPTTECLIYLTEPPYTIVTLSEVEIAYLERVMFGLKNFDLVFIFKDHTRPPVHITSIPMLSLEAIKDWLDSVDVLFAESTVNYNWTNIMKTVNDDPVGFYEMGGWSYLQPDADGAGQGSSDDEELSSEYEPDDEDDEFEEDEDDDEEEYEEDEDDEEEEDDEEDEDDEYSDEEDEDDAPDWDDLEEDARREDARKERESSSKRKPAPAAKSTARRK